MSFPIKGLSLSSRFLVTTVPYIAVYVGMYRFDSAWMAMLLYHAGMIIFLLLTRRGSLFKSLIEGFSAKVFIALIPVYLSAGVIIYFFWQVAKVDQGDLAAALAAFGLHSGNLLGFVIYYCLVNSTLEEVFWRGALIEENRFPSWSDLLFSGYHCLVVALFVSFAWVVLGFVVLLVGAWIWRTIARIHKGLALPWLTHFVADFGVMAAVYLLLIH